MKVLILSLMLGLLTSSVYGQVAYQPFPTDSTEWIIRNILRSNLGNSYSLSGYYLNGDTTLNGVQYTLVKSSYNGSLLGGIREDSTRKVWFYNFGGLAYCPNNSFDSVLGVGEETLLFDFGLQIGMGYKHKAMQLIDGNYTNGIDSAYSELTKIDSIQLLDGTYRRRLYIKSTMIDLSMNVDTLVYNSFWVDGVGIIAPDNMYVLGYNYDNSVLNSYMSHNGLFGAFAFSTLGSSPPSCENNLTCFAEKGIPLLGGSTVVSCPVINALPVIEKTFVEVVIAPNPFQEQTNVSINTPQNYQEIEMLIFNVLGQQLRSIRSNTKEISIERGQLSAGLYTYQIIGDDKLIAKGKLVVN